MGLIGEGKPSPPESDSTWGKGSANSPAALSGDPLAGKSRGELSEVEGASAAAALGCGPADSVDRRSQSEVEPRPHLRHAVRAAHEARREHVHTAVAADAGPDEGRPKLRPTRGRGRATGHRPPATAGLTAGLARGTTSRTKYGWIYIKQTQNDNLTSRTVVF